MAIARCLCGLQPQSFWLFCGLFALRAIINTPWGRLPLLPPTTHRCGVPGVRPLHKKRPGFDAVLTAYRFNGLLRSLLHDYKYRQALYLRSFLVKLMKDALPDDYRSECLIPVPLHALRLRQRGFNQTAELAKILAAELAIPCSLTRCQKIINTPTQAGLSGRQRRNNLKQSFRIKPMPYAHVTLVDDLLTTGSTASELARCLKQQGVQRVDVLCCARA